jgi:two-component system phosphate regulon response regulator PhoB
MEHTTTVLVIDDDDDNRQVFRFVLEDAHYRVLEAPDGLSGLEQLRTHPDPLVVLLDWVMPRMDGKQVLHAVVADASIAHRTAYILMSASAQRPEFHALTLPKDLDITFLGKPFDVDELFTLVAAAAARLTN